MAEAEPGSPTTMTDTSLEKSSVSQLLAERAELDERLKKEHCQNVAIFFCDVKGFTSFTETHGDLASRAMIQRLNDIAFPAIEEHGGHLVKTIGDAIMAYFEDAGQGVKFAIAVLTRLKEDNAGQAPVNHIHLRIGMNFGEVIVDQGDLYGDAVNIAARIEPQAKVDGILISPSLYEAVQDDGEIRCLYAKTVSMKGKSQTMPLYQVIWDGESVDDYAEAPPPEELAAKVAEGSPAVSGWKSIVPIVMLLILLAVGLKMFIHSDEQNGLSNPYAAGYKALRSGDIPRATNYFSELENSDPRYLESLAALSFFKKDYSETEKLLESALSTAGDRVFVYVLKGDLHFLQSRQQAAFAAYQHAVDQKKGLEWHRAMAYGGLGRIYAARGKNEEALASYVQAQQLAPQDSRILTDYGVLLEKLDKTSEALNVYHAAMQADPDDLLARQRLHIAKQQQQQKNNRERQQRIDQLVAELVAKFQQGREQQQGIEVGKIDPTRPLSIWFMYLQDKGDLPLREGESEAILHVVEQQLQKESGLQFVERDALDSLLTELKLGSSDLADQQLSLRIGHLFAARLLISGMIYRQQGEALVNLKIIETETSRIVGGTTVELGPTDTLLSAAEKIAQQLLRILHQNYPEAVNMKKKESVS